MEKCFAVVNGGDSVAARLELFGSCFISRAAKTENPVLRSFLAPKPNGNTCYVGYALRCTQMPRTFPLHALGSKLPPLIGIARMDLKMRLLYLKAKRNDRGPYTGLHLGPQSDLILHHFFLFYH